MAFSDPQTVTINAVAQVLNRVPSANGSFRKEDGLVSLTVQHSYNKRTRRVIRIDHSKIAADPFLAGTNLKFAANAYLVVDHPVTGYTNAELKQVVDGFLAYLSASSGANITKLLGGEG
jgi:hypothetical protein